MTTEKMKCTCCGGEHATKDCADNVPGRCPVQAEPEHYVNRSPVSDEEDRYRVNSRDPDDCVCTHSRDMHEVVEPECVVKNCPCKRYRMPG